MLAECWRSTAQAYYERSQRRVSPSLKARDVRWSWVALFFEVWEF